jgi:hypothetical protein
MMGTNLTDSRRSKREIYSEHLRSTVRRGPLIDARRRSYPSCVTKPLCIITYSQRRGEGMPSTLCLNAPGHPNLSLQCGAITLRKFVGSEVLKGGSHMYSEATRPIPNEMMRRQYDFHLRSSTPDTEKKNYGIKVQK